MTSMDLKTRETEHTCPTYLNCCKNAVDIILIKIFTIKY